MEEMVAYFSFPGRFHPYKARGLEWREIDPSDSSSQTNKPINQKEHRLDTTPSCYAIEVRQEKFENMYARFHCD